MTRKRRRRNLESATPSVTETPPTHRPGSQSDDGNLRAAYAALTARWVSNNDVLWRIIAFGLTAEVTAYVGLTQSDYSKGLHLLLGAAAGAVGVLAPLSVRYMETGLLMDRVLLDEYERAMLGDDSVLLQHHGDRLTRRVEIWSGRISEDRLRQLNARRFVYSAHAAGLNRFLDSVGQPSVVWSAAMAFGGAIAFDLGLWDFTRTLVVVLPVLVATNAFGLWVFLLASGIVGRIRKPVQGATRVPLSADPDDPCSASSKPEGSPRTTGSSPTPG